MTTEKPITYRHYLEYYAVADSKAAWRRWNEKYNKAYQSMSEPMRAQHLEATWKTRFMIQF
jgi:hypothetical protein